MKTRTKKAQPTTDIKEVVGVQVRRLRAEAAITQKDLADQCNIFRTYLSRIENGTANPTVTVVAALASALNVPITELLKRDA
jgi:transcriptional regulator with XRE-family HTH domain